MSTLIEWEHMFPLDLDGYVLPGWNPHGTRPGRDSHVHANRVGTRGELVPAAAPRPTSGAGKWVAAGHKVQVYRREDGTESFRGRDDGKVSPSFDTLEEAVRWVEGEREPEKVSEERTEAMEALREVVQR